MMDEKDPAVVVAELTPEKRKAVLAKFQDWATEMAPRLLEATTQGLRQMVIIADMQTYNAHGEERIRQALVGLENGMSVMPHEIAQALIKEFPDFSEKMMSDLKKALPLVISENKQKFVDRTMQLYRVDLESGELGP